MQPKATLIGKPEHPIGLLYFIWIQSRKQGEVYTPAEYQHQADNEYFYTDEYPKPISDTVSKILNEGIPVTECLYFTFYLENVPVSLREQLVRHRIGCHVGPEMGYDIIPDLATSTFWSQTSRAVSQGDFASKERYITPESCANYQEDGATYHTYRQAMIEAEMRYNSLLELGVPMEDARQVLPLAATQTMTWTLSLKSIQHILGKRACWIAQSGLWAPIISDMQRELSAVSPLFDGLVSPPCFERGKYVSCPFKLVNSDRIQGKEDLPPCPMFMWHERDSAEQMAAGHEHAWRNRIFKAENVEENLIEVVAPTDEQRKLYNTMRRNYKIQFMRNPSTGLPMHRMTDEEVAEWKKTQEEKK